MATVYKRAETGTWYAKYFDADGMRVSKNTGSSSKREAERIAAGFEAGERDERQKANQLPKAFAVILETVTREAASGDLTLARAEEFVHRLHKLANPDFTEASLEDFWKTWIADQKRHVGTSTANGYDNDFDLFVAALGKKVMGAPVNALTSEQVNAAIDKAKRASGKTRAKKDATRRASTVNKALASLRRVMEDAVAKGFATHNPAKQSRSLRQDDSIDKAPFTIAEIRSMLDHKDTSDEWRGSITLPMCRPDSIDRHARNSWRLGPINPEILRIARMCPSGPNPQAGGPCLLSRQRRDTWDKIFSIPPFRRSPTTRGLKKRRNKALYSTPSNSDAQLQPSLQIQNRN
jgi:hypothetical protein